MSNRKSAEIRPVDLTGVVKDLRLLAASLKSLGGLNDGVSLNEFPCEPGEWFRQHVWRSPFDFWRGRFKYWWQDLIGCLRRLDARLNHGDVTMLDCPEAIRMLLGELFHHLQVVQNSLPPEDKPPQLCENGPQQLQPVAISFGPELSFAIDELEGYDKILKSIDESESKRTSDANLTIGAEAQTPSDWPPKKGWRFRPGEASFDGKTFQISGIKWKLLQALVGAKGPLGVRELCEAGWPHDECVDDKTVRTHLSHLRADLRKAIGLAKGFNPIRIVDRGELAAWELHPKLRPV